MDTIEVLGKLHDLISRPILFAVFGVMCVILGVAGWVLLFHWNRYAIDKQAVITAEGIFFIGVALILLIGFISILLY